MSAARRRALRSVVTRASWRWRGRSGEAKVRRARRDRASELPGTLHPTGTSARALATIGPRRGERHGARSSARGGRARRGVVVAGRVRYEPMLLLESYTGSLGSWAGPSSCAAARLAVLVPISPFRPRRPGAPPRPRARSCATPCSHRRGEQRNRDARRPPSWLRAHLAPRPRGPRHWRPPSGSGRRWRARSWPTTQKPWPRRTQLVQEPWWVKSEEQSRASEQHLSSSPSPPASAQLARQSGQGHD